MALSRKNLWFAAILAAEAILFLWKYDHFFNGDSLFFFSNGIHSASDLWRVFQGPDHLWQYRPLTFIIFSFLLKPLFGLNPLGYNLFPLFVHAANTLIVFGVFRELGLAQRAALLGTFFFGAHSTAFYVTYGVAFLPDLSYSFFYFLSVFLFARYMRREEAAALAFSVLCFILALFCKEASITLPVIVFAIALLLGEQRLRMDRKPFLRAVRTALGKTLAFLVVGFAYLGFHMAVKTGQIYAPGIDHPHYSELSIQALQYKYKYLKWAFNLPDGLVFRFEGVINYLIAAAVLVFAIPFVLSTVRRLLALDRLTWCGWIWFVVALSPVLFLRNLTMHHNLYVPVVGLALLFGDWMSRASASLEGDKWLKPRAAVACCVVVLMAAVMFHNIEAAKDSWIAQASAVAKTSLEDMKRLRPVLPDGTTLYFVDESSLGSLRWYYDYGSLFRLFYPAKSIDVQFVDRGYSLPDRHKMPAKAFAFRYDGSRLTEIPLDEME